MTQEERMHATTWSNILAVDDVNKGVDEQLVTKSEDALKVWAYVMTQYNLKPGLRKFGAQGGAQGGTAVMDELTQLHVMDTWAAMDPSKLTWEAKMKALSSLLFLKEK